MDNVKHETEEFQRGYNDFYSGDHLLAQSNDYRRGAAVAEQENREYFLNNERDLPADM